ncbi:hypothetical protein [Photorhabdus heterorhabditis]|uniref:hypothetical protein n=1 Tax=Photorhabdus heterorhabditis TaxID=880156 RepID=UPI001561E0BA|nr:hypothetical protein [Photorhabdus heterorhabditis]NRN29899.1 hypothetical protein [Photorhabdus heterorhabditis subsp. aluminescens]
MRNSQAFLYKDIYGKQISNEDERMIDAAIKAIFSHPSHRVIYAPGDAFTCRRSAT